MNVTNKETIETYNLAFTKYIEESPQSVLDELKVWIDDNLSHLSSDAKILEIGSGSGRDAKYIVSRGYNVELTDASESFVEYLNCNGQVALQVNILVDDINSGYDMIFADAVFLHFTEQELVSVFHKTYRAIKDGGRLAFTLKVGSGEESTTRKLDAPRYFHYWQKDEIEKILKEVGFSEVHVNSGDDFRGEDRPDWLYVSAVR